MEPSVIAPSGTRCWAANEILKDEVKEEQPLATSDERRWDFPNDKFDHLTTFVRGNPFIEGDYKPNLTRD